MNTLSPSVSAAAEKQPFSGSDCTLAPLPDDASVTERRSGEPVIPACIGARPLRAGGQLPLVFGASF